MFSIFWLSKVVLVFLFWITENYFKKQLLNKPKHLTCIAFLEKWIFSYSEKKCHQVGDTTVLGQYPNRLEPWMT